MIYPSRVFLPINVILNVLSKVASFLPSQKKLMLKTNYNFMFIFFAKMEEKLLKVIPMCTCLNFGLKIELDSQCGRAYVIEIASNCIFTKSEDTTALSRIRDEGVCEFHITFAIEPTLTAKQRCHNANELALFDPQTKWKGNELPTNDLNRVNYDFGSSNPITVTHHNTQSRVDPDTAKFSSFQDAEDIEFEDMCDNDAPQLDIVTLHTIAAFRSGLDFSEESIPTDIILTFINSITSQAVTPAEQALGKFTRCKLKNMDTWND